MKFRIEIEPDTGEEIVLRAPALTDEVQSLGERILALLGEGTELALRDGERECYVPCDEILFFETADGRVSAHTAERMYYCSHKLYELEEMLPRKFMRASRSCLANTAKVCELTRSFTGGSEAKFRDSHKHIFISRMYDKAFREKIRETRLK